MDHFYGHAPRSAELANGILRRLKFDNDTRKKVVRLVQVHDDWQIPLTPKGVRRAVHRIGADIFPDYLKVRRADILAQAPVFQEEKLRELGETERLYQEIVEQQECLSLKDLAVTGRDLIAAGMEPGPELGRVLEELLALVIDHPEYTN